MKFCSVSSASASVWTRATRSGRSSRSGRCARRSATRPACGSTSPSRRRSRARACRGTGRRRARREATDAAPTAVPSAESPLPRCSQLRPRPVVSSVRPQPWWWSPVANNHAQTIRSNPVALLLCAIFVAPAQANFKVGMADQDVSMFDDSDFQALNIKRIRYLVPIDWYKHDFQVVEVASFLNGAADDARRARPLHGEARLLHERPLLALEEVQGTERQGLHERLQALPRDFPDVHRSACGTRATTSRSPSRRSRLAAKYFLAARKACRSCTFVAADVLDSNMRAGSQVPRRLKGQASIWGLHNYPTSTASARPERAPAAGRRARSG